MLEKIVYPELSYKINGICFQVHNEIGRFGKERQYSDRIEQLLIVNNIHYQREAKVPYKFNSYQVFGNIADFIIDDKIILEIKVMALIQKKDYFQVQRYLAASKLRLALLVNFRDRYLKPKRILNYSLINNNS